MNIKIMATVLILLISPVVLGMESSSSMSEATDITRPDGLTIAVGTEKIYVPAEVVALSGTLQDSKKDLKELGVQAENRPIPLNFPKNIPIGSIKNFLQCVEIIAFQRGDKDCVYRLYTIQNLFQKNKHLQEIVQRRQQGRPAADIRRQIKEIVSHVQWPIEKICTYAVLAHYLDVEIIAPAFYEGLAELIKRKQTPEDRFALVFTIMRLTNQAVMAEVAALLDSKKNIAEQKIASITVGKHERGSIQSIAFSSDGSIIASADASQAIYVWDIRRGKQLLKLTGEGKNNTLLNFTSVAFSPDGSIIASGSVDHTVRIWDAQTGSELQILEGHTSMVSSVAFSPDGSKIVSAEDDSKTPVRIWDAVTGNQLNILRGHTGGAASVAFSADGSKIASGSSTWDKIKTIHIWDAVTGNQLNILRGHTGGITSIAFSPDGSKIVSGSYDSTIRIWDVASGNQLATTPVHGLSIPVAFSPDGSKIAAGGVKILIVDAYNGAILKKISTDHEFIFSVAFSPDGSKIASNYHDEVRLWELLTPEINFTLPQAAGILSYAEARQHNQSFEWKDYPEILRHMHYLPAHVQEFLGIEPLKKYEYKLEKWELKKEHD